MNEWDMVRDALAAYRRMSSAMDSYASSMAGMLRGRLRRCSFEDLVALKKELRDFNINTGKWKP